MFYSLFFVYFQNRHPNDEPHPNFRCAMCHLHISHGSISKLLSRDVFMGHILHDPFVENCIVLLNDLAVRHTSGISNDTYVSEATFIVRTSPCTHMTTYWSPTYWLNLVELTDSALPNWYMQFQIKCQLKY